MNELELILESLEARQMMAGDVAVGVRGGDLVIQGDRASNSVVIHATANAHQFLVQAIDGTTVNGQSSVSVTGVDDDFRINLRSGDNQLVLTPYVAENSDVQRPFRVADDLTVRTGGGQDTILIGTLTVFGDARIQTGGGDDTVITLGTTFAGRNRLQTSAGEDFVYLADNVVADEFAVNLGSGADQLVGFLYQVGGDVNLTMGSGEDAALLRPVLVAGDHRVGGGAGNDELMTTHESPGMIDGQQQATAFEQHLELTDSELAVNMFAVSVGHFIEHDDLLERFLDR